MAAHQAPPPLGFSRQEHWSGLPFPSPMHESEKWKWSSLVVSDSLQPHRLQPTRLLCPWDFPGKILYSIPYVYWFLWSSLQLYEGFPCGSASKESTCNAGDPGSISVSGRSPGEGHGNLLQYSCLEKPMDRGAWWTIVYEVAESEETEQRHFHFPTLFFQIAHSSLDIDIQSPSQEYGERNDTPLQYSCLENPMDGGSW